jgi:hypothetical protein
MDKILNFKKLEVNGATKEEALAKAPFDIMGNATPAYKLWRKKQVNGITESDKKQFMLDYLANKSKNCANVGFYIVVESAVADTRERPYRINDVKNEKGTRHYKTVYQIKDAATGAVLAETNETKAKAKELAKALYTNAENPYKGNLVCTYTKQVVDGEPTAFTVDYTPSKSSQMGTYIVFGIERD